MKNKKIIKDLELGNVLIHPKVSNNQKDKRKTETLHPRTGRYS